MAVSSPYAVFRASDVCWPLVLPPALRVTHSLAGVGASEGRTAAERRRSRQTPCSSTMVQGELFGQG
jgi:hypothetical protein